MIVKVSSFASSKTFDTSILSDHHSFHDWSDIAFTTVGASFELFNIVHLIILSSDKLSSSVAVTLNSILVSSVTVNHLIITLSQSTTAPYVSPFKVISKSESTSINKSCLDISNSQSSFNSKSLYSIFSGASGVLGIVISIFPSLLVFPFLSCDLYVNVITP